MSVVRVCIATWELKHFTPGGIGTLVHNLLKTYGSDPRLEISILWYCGHALNDRLFAHVFPKCRFFSAHQWAEPDEDEGLALPAEAFRLDRFRQSFQLMRALRAIEKRHEPFEVIEFPDFGGAAFATLQEKRLGRGFGSSAIAVRLHSTEAVLRRNDHRPADFGNLMVADLERKALHDADIVVGHLKPIIEDVAAHFNFPESWRRKAICEIPPVLVDAEPQKRTQSFDEATPLVFTSKVQWFKRPHVFINAAVAFMNAQPDFKGEALLLAHVISGELHRHCLGLIPDALKHRIKILDSLPNAVRENLIAGSVAIFPSAHESFCLAAYEASLIGALVVLNNENPAFGNDTPWEAGSNCEKFDGITRGLVETLHRIWGQKNSLQHKPISLSPSIDPYWLRARKKVESWPRASRKEQRALSIVVASTDELGDPIETIRSALLADELDLDIIVACDLPASAPDRAAVLARIKESRLATEGPVKIVELGFRGGLAALCNLGLEEARNDIVAFARAGTSIDADFLADAVRALEVEPEYDFVIPQMAFESGPSNRKTLNTDRVWIGEALNAGLTENLFGPIEMVARRAAVASIGFDETLDRYVDWDFHLRACAAGHRYIVSNRIDIRFEALPPNAGLSDFRSHTDAVLVKHHAQFGGGTIPLAAAYDARQVNHSEATSLLFAKRPIEYYLQEPRPWWQIAYKRPIKPLRWLMLREVQLMRAQNGPGG